MRRVISLRCSALLLLTLCGSVAFLGLEQGRPNLIAEALDSGLHCEESESDLAECLGRVTDLGL